MKILKWLLITGFFLILPAFSKVLAANLLFEPTTVNTSAGQTFEINVNVNAGTEEIRGADAYILYDNNLLEVQQVNAGNFFPTVSYDTSQPGKIIINGILEDPATTRTGSGKLATIIFKAKTNGSTLLRFDCTAGVTTDSNIIKADTNSTDIIDCSANNQASINIGQTQYSSSTNTSSSTTDTNNFSSNSNNTSTLPRSGIFDFFLNYTKIGIIFLVIGTLLRFII